MARRTLLGSVALLVLATTNVGAETVSAPVQVSARVITNCHLAVSPLSFGDYDPLSSDSSSVDATSVVRLVCTKSAPASVSFDAGRNPHAEMRGLSGTSERLLYQVYRDAARTQVWTNGSGSMKVTASGDVRDPDELTVYGRIPGGQRIVGGDYFDVLTATVDF